MGNSIINLDIHILKILCDVAGMSPVAGKVQVTAMTKSWQELVGKN